MLSLKIIIDSTRSGRAADLVIGWISSAAKIMLDDLAWWATALQRARQEAPLPPAIMRRHATEGAR